MVQARRLFQRIGAFLAEAPPCHANPPSPFFDRFCIAFLSVDWIVFGSMHFSLHNATRKMLPPWVPFPDAIVVGTGIAEVAVGALMLYGRTRRAAALGSLLLLLLLMPAVFHILYTDDALPFDPASLPSRLWRLLGVPHNALMAICSLHLLRKPYPDPWDVSAAGRPLGGRSSLLAGRGAAALLVAIILLLCNAAGFLAVLLGARGNVPTAAMWMMMCLAVGALLGFLFAVPRANEKASDGASLLPNRNIEAVSDWLTKILVGLGLVNFRDIGAFLAERSAVLAPALGVDANYALALIVYFLVAGFLEGYLLTRLFLQWHFVDAAAAEGAPRDAGGKEPRAVVAV